MEFPLPPFYFFMEVFLIFWRIFLNPDLLGSLLGASLSGFFAVMVFYFGLREEKRKEKRKEKSYLDEIQAYLIASLDVIIKSSLKQSEYLISFTREIRKRDFFEKSFLMNVSFKTSGIKSIPPSDIFKMLNARSKSGAVAYKKLQNNLELISEYEKHIPLAFNEFNEVFRKTQDSFGESSSMIQSIYDRNLYLLGCQMIPFEKDEFVTSWKDLIVKWLEKEKEYGYNNIRDPYFVFDDYIKLLKEFIKFRFSDRRAIELMGHVNNCEYQITVYDQARKSFTIRLVKMARNLVHTSIELKEVLSELKKEK